MIRSLALFVLAGLCEIGGGYLVWQWWRQGAPPLVGALGAAVLVLYGFVPTYQPQHFGRVYADRLGPDVRQEVEVVHAEAEEGDRVEVAAEAQAVRQGGVELDVAVRREPRGPVVHRDVVLVGQARADVDIAEPLRRAGLRSQDQAGDAEQRRRPELRHCRHLVPPGAQCSRVPRPSVFFVSGPSGAST